MIANNALTGNRAVRLAGAIPTQTEVATARAALDAALRDVPLRGPIGIRWWTTSSPHADRLWGLYHPDEDIDHIYVRTGLRDADIVWTVRHELAHVALAAAAGWGPNSQSEEELAERFARSEPNAAIVVRATFEAARDRHLARIAPTPSTARSIAFGAVPRRPGLNLPALQSAIAQGAARGALSAELRAWDAGMPYAVRAAIGGSTKADAFVADQLRKRARYLLGVAGALGVPPEAALDDYWPSWRTIPAVVSVLNEVAG